MFLSITKCWAFFTNLIESEKYWGFNFFRNHDLFLPRALTSGQFSRYHFNHLYFIKQSLLTWVFLLNKNFYEFTCIKLFKANIFRHLILLIIWCFQNVEPSQATWREQTFMYSCFIILCELLFIIFSVFIGKLKLSFIYLTWISLKCVYETDIYDINELLS